MKHHGIINADMWAHSIKDTKDLKHAVRKLIKLIEETSIPEDMYPTAQDPKLKIRGPIGEILALSFFELTRIDNRVGYDKAVHGPIGHDERICKGLSSDDRGVDIIMFNKEDALTTCQAKLITNPQHMYGSLDHERMARSSYIEESVHILNENDYLIKEDSPVKQQVFFMTCQAMPDYTSDKKLHGKVRQLCFSKTDNKKGVLNINDFTSKRFMNTMYELIMDSSSSAKKD
jgi:hypothetical protein